MSSISSLLRVADIGSVRSQMSSVGDCFRRSRQSGNHPARDLGARCLAAATCKACASSPGRQEQHNFGPIGPPMGL